MSTSDFVVARGETKQWTLTAKNLAGVTVDITGAKVYFTVRGLDDALVFQRKSTAAGGDNNQIEILDQVANGAADRGKFVLKVTHANTDIEPDARFCDCWVQTATEYLQVVDAGSPFYVKPAATTTFV
jgi:hypothetical protein